MKLSLDDIRDWQNGVEEEIDGCATDIDLTIAALSMISDNIEAYTDAKRDYGNSLASDLRMGVRNLESVKKRLEGILNR